jgi:hypothetical protein
MSTFIYENCVEIMKKKSRVMQSPPTPILAPDPNLNPTPYPIPPLARRFEAYYQA